MSEQQCPNCSNTVPELIRLDEAFRKTITETLGSAVAESICSNCFSGFDKKLSAVKDKETRRATKEASRLSLWRRRVDIMRDARDRFADKDFSGAVVSYEKYLRVIEMIYDTKPNQLKVSFFNNPARAKELVLITSAYWDLVRIYDQSDRFSKRFEECADKLIEFLPFTPMYSELLHRVEDHKKIAKHRDTFQRIYKLAQKKKKRCFIATAAFQDGSHPTVDILCRYRDEVLLKSSLGSTLVDCYYVLSPPVAQLLDMSPTLRSGVRSILDKTARTLEQKYHLKRPSN